GQSAVSISAIDRLGRIGGPSKGAAVGKGPPHTARIRQTQRRGRAGGLTDSLRLGIRPGIKRNAQTDDMDDTAAGSPGARPPSGGPLPNARVGGTFRMTPIRRCGVPALLGCLLLTTGCATHAETGALAGGLLGAGVGAIAGGKKHAGAGALIGGGA